MEGKVHMKQSIKNIAINTIIIKEPLLKREVSQKKNSTLSCDKPAAKKRETKIKFMPKEIENRRVVSKSLLDKLQSDLTSLEKVSEVLRKDEKIKVPVLSSLEINQIKQASTEPSTEDFQSKLTDFFKSHLKLPEYGGVKVRMKIQENGKIDDIFVISSENKKNEEYLKNILLKISVPCFFSQKEDMELVICFTNDI